MLITNFPYTDENGREYKNLILTYSSNKMKMLQNETNILYDTAVDVYPCRFTYTETDIPIDENEE